MTQHYFRHPSGHVLAVAGPHATRAAQAGYVEVDETTARTEVPELFAGEIHRQSQEAHQ